MRRINAKLKDCDLSIKIIVCFSIAMTFTGVSLVLACYGTGWLQIASIISVLAIYGAVYRYDKKFEKTDV